MGLIGYCGTSISCPVVRTRGNPRLLRREGIRKGTKGGKEGAGEATSFCTTLLFAAWNCCGLTPESILTGKYSKGESGVEWMKHRLSRRS